MNIHGEILRYMGHAGKTDARLDELVASCLEKLDAVAEPRHVTIRLPCTVRGDCVAIDELWFKSKDLAVHLKECTQLYIFAATLGAGVDRLITQRAKMDSAEALCLQACAAARIENRCNAIEKELLSDGHRDGLCLRPRFSPGYGDFDIAYQTDILRVLQAHKKIGVTETAAHVLTPLKSVTALVGGGTEAAARVPGGYEDKCSGCGKTDCPFRASKQEVL